MKITKGQIKRIIREERAKLLSEQYDPSEEILVETLQLIDDLRDRLASKYPDGQIGDAALEAKLKGEMAAYEILTRAAKLSRAMGTRR